MKAIFLDIDGTILDYSGVIPDSAIRAIDLAQKNGNIIFINSGRSKAEIPKQILQLNSYGYICSNAMYIEDDGKIIRNEFIPQVQSKKIITELFTNEVGFSLECFDCIYVNKIYFEKAIEVFGAEVANTFRLISFEEMCELSSIAKINFTNEHNLYFKLKSVYGNELQINTWSNGGVPDSFGEVTIIGANKVNGIETILKNHNIELKDSFAFGDADGDIQMLNHVGYGIAMGNACQALKNSCSYVTDSVLDNGLFNAFKRFNLI